MAQLIIYKSALDSEILLSKDIDLIKDSTLSKAAYSCKEIHNQHVMIWLNDTLVPVDDWHMARLESSDHVRIKPVPHETTGQIGGAAIGFIWGWAVGGPYGAVKGAMIGYAIGAVIDPTELPEIKEDDPNYGWDGAKITTAADSPITVLYGEYLISGTLIMQYISSDGSDNFLHVLINLGEGPIEGIMKADESGVCTSTSDTPYIQINGQMYSSYSDIEWDYRLGTTDQTIIEGFRNVSTFINDGRKIEYETSITYTTTGTEVEEVEVVLMLPWLHRPHPKGGIQKASVWYKIEYKVTGNGGWTTAYDTYISQKSTTAIYLYKKISDLPPEQYDIRVTRAQQDAAYTWFVGKIINSPLYLSGVTETLYESIAYRNSALLALKIRATDQLYGSIPNVTVLTRGKTVLVPDLQIAAATQTYDDCYWDDGASNYKLIIGDTVCTDTGNFVRQWTRNPLWNSRDFILNSRYGLGEYIDIPSFDNTNAAIEAKYCWEMVTDFDGGTEHRFEMDLPISQVMDGPSAMRLLARTFRGWIIWSGGVYKPIIDRTRTETQLFNGSNVDITTIKTNYFRASQIPNFVEMQHADPLRNYAINALEIVDEDEWSDVKPLRRQTVNAKGTVRYSQNLRDGRYYLNCGRYCTKGVEWISDLDAVHCEPGDIVRYQDDLLAWGVGGRVVSATTTSITTNIDITYTAGYEVRARLSDGTLETKTVTSVTNNNRTINISGSFTSAPPVDSVFTYGASDVDSKPFKVQLMSRTEDNRCRLIAIEESTNKYLDTIGVSLPDPTYTTLPNPADPPANVTDLTLTEMASQPGFYIAFHIPREDLNFAFANVHLSLDNEYWWLYSGNVTVSGDIEVTELLPGQTYFVKVISYNYFGMANVTPVTDSITLTWLAFLPPDVTGLRLDGETNFLTTFTKRDAKFKWNRTSTTTGAGREDGAGQEVLGAGETTEIINYKYWVEIYVAGARKRKEIINDVFYTYTYEKNVHDNVTASNIFTIKVWAYNEVANLKSKNPNSLQVTNPAPANTTNLQVAGTGSTSAWSGRDVNITWDIIAAVDFDYYEVQVLSNGGATTRRIEQIQQNYYTYSYDMNNDDEVGTPVNILIFRVRAYDTFGSGGGLAEITITNPAPAQPSGLTGTPWMEGVKFLWTPNTEIDLDYYKYKIQVESAGWSAWINTTNVEIFRFLTEAEVTAHGSDATIYIEVTALDTFENESGAASTNATCLSLNIDATDINDFAITASKIFTKIPILDADSWSDNSPGAGSVAWNAHTLYYNGVAYSISASDTALKYIYWVNAASAYTKSDTNPVLADGDFIIAVNITGLYDLAWNAIANQVVGSAYIQDLAVVEAKIGNLAVTDAKINDLHANKINAGSISVTYTDADVTSDQFTNALATIDSQVDKVELGLDASGVLITKAVPASVAAPGGAGLFLGSDYMGYYSGSAWTAYIENDGSVKFGSGTEYFQYTVAGGVLISTAKANAITIKSGGDITLEAGGDINFVGSSYTTTFNANATGSQMDFEVSSNNAVSLFFTHGLGNKFSAIQLTAVDHITLMINDGTDNSELTLDVVGSEQRASFYFEDGAVQKYIRAVHQDGGAYYFGPDDDGNCDLGRTATRWATVYCDDIEITNGLSVNLGTIQTGSIMLPFNEGVSISHLTNSATYAYVDTWRVYVPADATNIRMACRTWVAGSGTPQIQIILDVGGLTDETTIHSNGTAAWYTDILLDVSSLSGWYDLKVGYRNPNAITAIGGYLAGWSLMWET